MSDYPSEEVLKCIEDWSCLDPKGCLEFVAANWSYPDCVRWTPELLILSTSGWSGNESLIAALRENSTIWSMTAESWRRGGRYEFRIVTIKKVGE